MAEQHSSPYVDQGTSSAASSRSVLSPQEFASPFLSAVPALVPSHRSSSGASGRASSSSASTTSSPSTSPSPWAASQTAVLGSSPPALALPPQAYPIAQASPLVEPVKIPPMLIRAPASLDGHASRGDETLKYVRRPGATSHLTSPLALFPIAGPTRKSFSGNHSNAGNSPRLSPMLSPLIAPTKLPKQGSLGKVRCDRPGCTLLHSALYGRNQLGIKSDLTVHHLPRLDGEDTDLTAGPCPNQSEDEDDHRPHVHHTHSASDTVPSPDRLLANAGRHHSHDVPLTSASSARASPPAALPAFIRRASVPANHYVGSLASTSSYPSEGGTPVSRIPSDSSDHASIHPSPLAQPPDVSSPELETGHGNPRRGRSRQRSPSTDRHRLAECSRGSSSRGGRDALASRSRSRVRSPPRSSRSSTDRGSESRGRRGESSRRPSERAHIDEREEATPRGRRDSSRIERVSEEQAAAEADDGVVEDRGRGRSGSNRRTPMAGSNGHGSGKQQYEEAVSRSPSTSPEPTHLGLGGLGTRGRRPTVVVKPAPFTTLSSDGVVRSVHGSSSSSSRSRDRDEKRADDARGRMRSLRIAEA